MDWTIFLGPIVGAMIGYCTNYIAVKMLFRPYQPKYIFGRQLPFTPGIVPKSKGRIALAVGSAVGENLLTQDALEKNLLSPDLLESLRKRVNETIHRETQDQRKVRDIITFYMDGDEFDHLMDQGEAVVSEILIMKILDMDLGNLVGAQVLKAIHEKQEESFAAKFLTENFIHSLVDGISDRTNEMILHDGPDIIQGLIHREFEGFQDKTMAEIFSIADGMDVDFGQKVCGAYEVVIRKRLPEILATIDISRIVREKLDGMDPGQLEELTLKVARKELGAIINLGALIGLVLGSLNMLTSL